ncbi:MAG: hypothetical protein A2Z59_10065 [Nitrospinae bacterium RIFCSPLOWO2_02_39_17]|nr:MAG: hypothetical protein A3D20_00195 [Nitrospinae bacterium RIFCSPHIGHO2_02_FULL_39_82]OGW07161.1 MAG: hypothetical protein A2Z59_10065 [Nitrospinae bacterium RIFCSPLOWO2_02_39_17]OGW10670.1 MAG: hypothetical protein A2W75_00890 [Nitrospinae bacterium RIFCSPLOWO2_12_39_15]
MQTQAVKVIGSSGQISIGKEYAGRSVVVEEIEEGVWLIKTARVIPDNEMWMHEEPGKSRIDKAIEWAKKHKASETNIERLSEKIG